MLQVHFLFLDVSEEGVHTLKVMWQEREKNEWEQMMH